MTVEFEVARIPEAHPVAETVTEMMKDADRLGLRRLSVLAALALAVGGRLEAEFGTSFAAATLRAVASHLEDTTPQATHIGGHA